MHEYPSFFLFAFAILSSFIPLVIEVSIYVTLNIELLVIVQLFNLLF